MANILKLIIPLATDCITIEDLDTSDKMGFVGAFLEDVNRPYLTNKLMLMYKSDVFPSTIAHRNYKFMNSKHIYNKRVIRINNVWYTVFTFSIIDKDVLKIIDGIVPTDNDKYLKIHKFWKFKDDFINRLLCCRSTSIKEDNTNSLILPEEDYIDIKPSLIITKDPDVL